MGHRKTRGFRNHTLFSLCPSSDFSVVKMKNHIGFFNEMRNY